MMPPTPLPPASTSAGGPSTRAQSPLAAVPQAPYFPPPFPNQRQQWLLPIHSCFARLIYHLCL